ncbi:hypothetical protein [Rhodohalobacter sp. 8-1]|uniref:hypothetical protein n=1 Tax=Rhodohalobacter sp. 8-1 TaxID=3131972 RepID=UPI0030EB5100
MVDINKNTWGGTIKRVGLYYEVCAQRGSHGELLLPGALCSRYTHPEDLVTGMDQPIVENGPVIVEEKPGLVLELIEEVVRQHLIPGKEMFAPTEEWNEVRSNHRLWS